MFFVLGKSSKWPSGLTSRALSVLNIFGNLNGKSAASFVGINGQIVICVNL